MARVELKSDGHGTILFTVDGVDLGKAVAAEGFSVKPDATWPGRFRVTMVLRPDSVDIDLPDAVLDALRADDEVTG